MKPETPVPIEIGAGLSKTGLKLGEVRIPTRVRVSLWERLFRIRYVDRRNPHTDRFVARAEAVVRSYQQVRSPDDDVNMMRLMLDLQALSASHSYDIEGV